MVFRKSGQKNVLPLLSVASKLSCELRVEDVVPSACSVSRCQHDCSLPRPHRLFTWEDQNCLFDLFNRNMYQLSLKR